MLPDIDDPFKLVDLPAGLTVEEAYALGHRDGYTARAQHNLVDLLDVADPADAEDRHAAVHRIADRGRAA